MPVGSLPDNSMASILILGNTHGIRTKQSGNLARQYVTFRWGLETRSK